MAGIVVGAAVDILWVVFLGSFGLYEIIPGFLAGMISAVIASLTDKEPDQKVQALFDRATRRERS